MIERTESKEIILKIAVEISEEEYRSSKNYMNIIPFGACCFNV